jgi:hypothetical protein
MSRPTKLHFSIPSLDASITATLHWEEAPRTCAAVLAALPFTSKAFHGRNSGDEAVCLLPECVEGVPQDASEGGTESHSKNMVLFGTEAAGSCYGGAAAGTSVSEVAWIYGPAAQAQYWVSEHGPPHTEPPFRFQKATLNHFATFEEVSPPPPAGCGQKRGGSPTPPRPAWTTRERGNNTLLLRSRRSPFFRARPPPLLFPSARLASLAQATDKNFYKASGALQRRGEQDIRIWAE